MTPPPPDDLRDARAADRLNAWLDGTEPTSVTEFGPIARATARIARTDLPDSAIRRHEETLWEGLMRHHTSSANVPISVLNPTTLAPNRSDRPNATPRRRSLTRRSSGPVGRLVATLTLVALVGLSAVSAYIAAPGRGNDPTVTLAAAGFVTADAGTATLERSTTPARPDAYTVTSSDATPSIWRLPPYTAYDLPTLEILGENWSPLGGRDILYYLGGTAVQAENHTYVDNQGNRVRTFVAYLPEYGPADQARDWVSREIDSYRDALDQVGAEIDDPPGRVPAGCDDPQRTAGLEPVTQFRTEATGCVSADGSVMVLVSVSGSVPLPGYGGLDNTADELVAKLIVAAGADTAMTTPMAG